MKKRLISILLIFCMVVTLFPLRTFPVVAAPGKGVSVLSPSIGAAPGIDVSNLKDIGNNTVLMPIGERGDVYDIRSDVSVYSMDALDANMIYMPRNIMSFIVWDLILPDGTYTDTARLQLVDENQNLIATSAGENFYTYTDSSEEIVLNYEELDFLENPTEGNYTLQVLDGAVADSVISTITATTVTVVDAPFINYGSISDLKEGTGEFFVNLDFYNFQGTPDDYILTLFDSELNEISVEVQNRYIDQLPTAVSVSYSLRPNEAINAHETYTLGITYTGSGGLYSLTDTISTTAVEADLLSITAVETDEAVAGGILIYTENTVSSNTYNVTIYDSNDDYIYYSGNLSPDADGIFAVSLMKNGIVLPLSVYRDLGIRVEVSDDTVTDSFYKSFYIENNDSYAGLEITRTCDPTQYDFTLTGHNMLQDIYDNPDLSFTLMEYQSGSGYLTVGESAEVIERHTSHASYFDRFVMSGTFTTTGVLDGTTHYYIFVNNELIALAKITSTEGLCAVDVYVPTMEYNSDTGTDLFYFCYGVIPVSASLSGSSGTAKAQLIDSGGSAVSESETTEGNYISPGVYEYEFEIPSAANISPDDSYSIVFVDGESSVASYYADMIYDDTVTLPDYWSIDDTILTGDTSIEIYYYENSVKNITTEILEGILPSFTRVATNEELSCTDYSVQRTDNRISITLSFSTAFKYGKYNYSANLSDDDTDSIYARDAGTPELGVLNSSYSDNDITGTYFLDCENLNETGVYKGWLYRYDDGWRLESENLTLSLDADGTTLTVNNLPSDLAGDGDYKIAVWCDDTLIGMDGLSVPPDESSTPNDIFFITGHYLTFGDYSEEYIDYLTPNAEILFDAYKSGYAYVRFAESDLSSSAYVPIRSRMEYTLSSGEGEKIVYVQFKKTDGTESAIYSYKCCLSESAGTDIAIISAFMEPEYNVPEDTEFTVTLVSATRLCNVNGKLLYSENGEEEEYFTAYPFNYVEAQTGGGSDGGGSESAGGGAGGGGAEGGYEFQLTLNSGEYPFTVSGYNWTGIRCYVQSLDGSDSVSIDIPMQIGDPVTPVQYSTISGIIVTEDGNGLGGVEVTVIDYETGEVYGTYNTDENGSWSCNAIVGNVYEISYYCYGYTFNDNDIFAYPSEDGFLMPETTATPGIQYSTISGIIVTEDGNGLGGVEVTVIDYETGEVYRTFITDENGSWSCDAIVGNVYEISYYCYGYTFNNNDIFAYPSEDGFQMPETTATPEIAEFFYDVIDESYIRITGHQGNIQHMTIPGEIDGYIVKEIGEYAFHYEYDLESVTLPDTLEVIGESAFEGCNNLSTVNFGNGLLKIKQYAFHYCQGLTEIVFPDSVTDIGYCAFLECTNLKNVNFPATLESIGNAAFAYCVGLTDIEIPEGITDIPENAFNGCSLLRAIKLHSSLKSIGYSAFSDCARLTGVVIPEGVTSIGNYAFMICPELLSVSIPESVTSFGAGIFNECPKLTIIGKPDSLAMKYAVDNNIVFKPSEGSFSDSEERCLDRSNTLYATQQTGLSAAGTVDFILEYNFKDAVSSQITNMNIKIRLLENSSLISQSLRINGTAFDNYDINNNILSFNVSETSGSIRFSVKPEGASWFMSSYALIDFKKDGITKNEVIGFVNTEMPFITIEAEKETGTGAFTVSGIAPANTQVNVYIDDILSAMVTSLRSGRYSADIAIDAPLDYKNYTVMAATASDKALSASTMIRYATEYPEIDRFVMYYYGYPYDLMDPENTNPLIAFSGGKPTFAVSFSNNEDISHVNVVSERNGVKKYLEAVWSESAQEFIASGYFDPANPNYLPGTVTVEYSKVRPAITPGDPVDFTSPIFTEGLPPGALDTDINVIENTATSYEAGFRFDGALGEVIQDELTMVISEVNKEYGLDYSEYLQSYDGFLSYFAKGYNDEKYILNIDKTDPEKVTLLVHEISSNKLITTVLEYADDGSGYVISDALEALGTASQISGLLLNKYDIENEDDELRDRIWSSSLNYEEKLEALKRADTLKRDREMFMTLSLIMTIAAPAAAGPAGLVFSLLIGSIQTSSSYFWDMRMLGILSGGHGTGATFRWIIDPSGYVYEAVTTNRLEGVTASAYWKEPGETEAKPWEAADWNQQNPLQTDRDGRYAWDVPEGMWQVQYGLAGYETAYSEWLPVPPPQTEVNIGMTSLASPEIAWGKVYGEYAEAEFSKYMIPSTITGDSLVLRDSSGVIIPYTLEYSTDETDLNGTVFAKRYQLIFNNNYTAPMGEIYSLSVSDEARSYANIAAQDHAFSVACTEQLGLTIPESIDIEFGKTQSFDVNMSGYDAGSGAQLEVSSDFGLIAEVVSVSPISNDGKVTVLLKGNMIGEAEIGFSIADAGISKSMTARVILESVVREGINIIDSTFSEDVVQAVLSNDTDEAISSTVFCAAYDSPGRLITVRQEDVSDLAGNTQMNLNFNFEGITGMHYYKIFTLHSDGSYAPFNEVYIGGGNQ